MNTMQAGIVAPVPRLARYLGFSLQPGANPEQALNALRNIADGERTVVGLGDSLVRELGRSIDGLRSFAAVTGAGIDIPSTQLSLWCWLRGDDRGELVHRTRSICDALDDAFDCGEVIDAFQYGNSQDLTGYEDGTENPKGEDAIAAAFVQGQGKGLDGSSFVAVQTWLHDLDRFEDMTQQEQDNAMGRRRSDNEELDEAPPSAHVKRTAQESFDPEAFILRRSMPWADADDEGLVFVAFGKSFAAYETLLQHMLGLDDGVTDALFKFTRPLTGGYYWCPPMVDGKLDLSRLGF
jgi:putative iron-dependent peroxidase